MPGLLRITVIGAVLRARQGVALRHGVTSAPAFIDGYHAGLIVTIALVAVGAIVGYAALRRAAGASLAPVPVPATAAGPEPAPARPVPAKLPGVAQSPAPGPRPGPWPGWDPAEADDLAMSETPAD
jgi:hypothetical protein